MRFYKIIKNHFLKGSASKLVIGLIVLLAGLSLSTIIQSKPVYAEQSSAQVTCLSFQNGQPEAFDITVGDNINGPSTYEGGYPVFQCLGGQDLVIRPSAPASTVHTLDVTCPTSSVVIEEKTLTTGNTSRKYVVARCTPPGETLTLSVQDPPGTQTQHAGQYQHSNNPANVCPPNCGIDQQPPPPGLPAESVEICRRRASPPGGVSGFDVDGCIAEINSNSSPQLFLEAAQFWCTLQVEPMPAGTEQERQARGTAYNKCLNEKLTAAGFELDEQEEAPSCENKGGELSWLLCPALRLADNIVGYIDEQIQQLLEVPNAYFEGEGSDKLRNTWGQIRNIAYIVLIPITLVMVIGTATGSSRIDAYTVKKAFPRLFIAIIFIAVSYELSTFLIVVTNNIGSSILGLLTNAFGGGKITLAELFDPGFVAGGLFTGTVVIAPVAGFALAGIGVLLSYALVVGVVLFMGFLLLAMRQFLLLALVLLAPAAILAWIFPGNDKLWKLWFGTFSKLLLLFPLIMILIASGRIFAAVVNSADGSGLLETILKLTAYVAPYFFIPATFKFAGGVFANLAGIVNNKEKGFFDRQRKHRDEAMKKRKDLASQESLFNKNHTNPFLRASAKFGNKLTSWTASPIGNAQYAARDKNIPFFSMQGRRIAAGIEEKTLEQSKKLFQKLNESGANDKTYRALSGAHDGLTGNVTYNGRKMKTWEALKEAGLYNRGLSSEKDIMAAAEIMRGSDSHTESLAAGALERVAPVVASTYSDPESAKADIATAGLMGLAAHGFADGKDLAQVGNIIAGKKGLHYADAAVVQAEVIGMRSRPDIKAGYGHAIVGGKIVDGMSDKLPSMNGGRAWDLMGTLSQSDIMQAKGGSLVTLSGTMKELVRAGNDPHAAAEAWRQAGLSDEVINRRLKIAQTKAPAVRDTILLLASRYSQAPIDTKAAASQMVNELGLMDALREHDAAALRAQGGAGGGEDGGGGAGGGGAGGGGAGGA